MIAERNINGGIDGYHESIKGFDTDPTEEPDYLRFIISEIYVRDHLLIQWLIENIHKYIDPVTGSPKIIIEELYKDWIKWLKEREEAHGEGSTV